MTIPEINNLIKRAQLKQELKDEFDSTLEDRMNRSLEIDRQWIIGNHYFSEASAECIRLYRDGYFIATVMMSHAINEGIIKFIAERNSIQRHLKGQTKSEEELLLELKTGNFISEDCLRVSQGIMRSFRADIHHMNPSVAGIPFLELAKSNMERLSLMEKEIFFVNIFDGKLRPKNPQYWDLNSDGTVNAYLRIAS